MDTHEPNENGKTQTYSFKINLPAGCTGPILYIVGPSLLALYTGVNLPIAFVFSVILYLQMVRISSMRASAAREERPRTADMVLYLATFVMSVFIAYLFAAIGPTTEEIKQVLASHM